MKFTATPLAGASILDLERIEDDRGFFARSFCTEEFAAHGLNGQVSQCSVSFNRRRGTLRGMHYQAPPHEEDKVVRCTAGAVYDVIVDLRADSATHRRWFGVELSAENRRALFVPKGFAHGFLTLADATELAYSISVPYAPGASRGLRWNDPALGIRWPAAPAVISPRDAAYALLDDAAAAGRDGGVA